MQRIIELALSSRPFVFLFFVAVLLAGYFSYQNLSVEAYPDISPALVQVFVETEGLAPEEVEKYVTYPIENAMSGLPQLDYVRSISNFGLSVVNIYFYENTDIYFARQLVGERLQLAREDIPEQFGAPRMGPISTGLGQVLFYVLEDKNNQYSNSQLREVQDWLVKLNLQTVKGVAEVLSVGGAVKQFQVVIDPLALRRFNLSLPEVKRRIEMNNANAGAQFIVKNDEEYIVRSVGLVSDLDDIGRIVVKTLDGTPVYLRQLGELKIGGETRRGVATKNGMGEVVVGMVLKLAGSNTDKVISAVKQELEVINEQLPDGLEVAPYYDQATLVNAALNTVVNALALGVAIVTLVLFIFLGSVRPSVVVALSIPFSLAFAFVVMYSTGLSANLMSLGGIAIAIGMMVDGALVVVENIERALRENHKNTSMVTIVANASGSVVRPIVFAISIIVIVFLPLFTLQGVEGATFRPLAYTVVAAMLGSLFFAVFVAPVLSSLLLTPYVEKRTRRGKSQTNIYLPVVASMIKYRGLAVVLAMTLLLIGAFVAPRLGSEFVPRLNEGDLLIRVTMAPSISLVQAEKIISVFENQLLERFPEVSQVVSRVGRGEVGAHADPVNNAEVFVELKPKSEWRTAHSLDGLYAAMSESFVDFPGAQFSFTQPIAASVDELLTGTKAELAIKLVGDNLDVLAAKSGEVETVIRSITGAHDVQRDQIGGTPQLRIELDREAIARYGLNVSDVQEVVSIAIGGARAGEVLEGVKRFSILLRLEPKARDSVESIRRLVIENGLGQNIPLSTLASVEEVVGPRQITRENNQRFITVQTNVRGRDIGSFVHEADQAIKERVDLPAGYFLRWGGQFELQRKANERLMLVVPITLVLVLFMLYLNFNALTPALLIILNIPLALVGGLVALWLSGQSLSVPASVGFIALFGIALENSLVMIARINELIRQGKGAVAACIEGAGNRLRSVLMTAITTAAGLSPLLFASDTGSEVQKPLATVVVGGLVSATLLTLLVLPAVYSWFASRAVRLA
ncbi:CusA/CzcA family heavy metal efflux RND transporter [Gilvimarinus sp. SDUM040013]|uniref:CusA/CzcA family heavy metal efflux RND transporter n=1 Tax=Gilvimarinus gilvus TaxID=3058038 RepID=A0ABU4S1M4_9GAMM|nr:CusA/CzcA family heavy metal efflux RND transporter [Gilvimarinus sp. SDUM040013]MDO3386553.1 CusA/CzcA family heavy metal efflux RND transporter [Gilvimarinus sp. SDUM040013]MDX6849129.1 CusA/CzcA family heavy metal efflux RND transporter [Gilvimarinus sp. SDUM040013]